MEKYKEKLRSDAQQLAEYADTSEYLTRAFFHIFGKKLLAEGYVDCSYILGALGKGTYYSRLRHRIPLFIPCMQAAALPPKTWKS